VSAVSMIRTLRGACLAALLVVAALVVAALVVAALVVAALVVPRSSCRARRAALVVPRSSCRARRAALVVPSAARGDVDLSNHRNAHLPPFAGAFFFVPLRTRSRRVSKNSGVSSPRSSLLMAESSC